MSKVTLAMVQIRWKKALVNSGFDQKQAEELVAIMSEIYLTRDDVLDKFDNQREALLARIDRNGDNTGEKLTTLNTSVTRIETRQLTTTKTIVFAGVLVSLAVGLFSLWQFIEPLL